MRREVLDRLGAPDASLSRISAPRATLTRVDQRLASLTRMSGLLTPVRHYQLITTWEPSYLWLGGVIDKVAGETLTLVAGATTGPTDGLRPGLLNESRFRFAAPAQAAEATDSTLLDAPPVSHAMVVVFRLSLPIFLSGLGGKRELGPSFRGWEIGITPQGRINFLYEADTSAIIQLTQPYSDGAWHVLVAVIDRSANTFTIASELESTSAPLPAGSAAHSVPAALGRQRRLAAPHDNALFSWQTGAQVEQIAPILVAQNLAAELIA